MTKDTTPFRLLPEGRESLVGSREGMLTHSIPSQLSCPRAKPSPAPSRYAKRHRYTEGLFSGLGHKRRGWVTVADFVFCSLAPLWETIEPAFLKPDVTGVRGQWRL